MYRVNDESVRAPTMVHQLERVPEESLVCHRRENPPCVRPSHLFAGTPSRNPLDRDRKGRRRGLWGEEHQPTTPTEGRVREIVRRNRAGEAREGLAAEYGVSSSPVRCIAACKTWGHVTGISHPSRRDSEKP